MIIILPAKPPLSVVQHSPAVEAMSLTTDCLSVGIETDTLLWNGMKLFHPLRDIF